MKVLAINGSPHANGGTATAIDLVAQELKKENIEVETLHVGIREVRGCTACFYCVKNQTNRCIYEDIVNEAIEIAESADGLLIASPVYYAGIAGTMKSFLDRLFFASSVLDHKVGAAISCTRRAGDVTTFHQLNNYFNLRQMIIAPSQYWNVIHGTNPDEVMQDKEGVQIMQTLGKNMAWVLKLLENGKDIPVPQKPERVATNFIR